MEHIVYGPHVGQGFRDKIVFCRVRLERRKGQFLRRAGRIIPLSDRCHYFARKNLFNSCSHSLTFGLPIDGQDPAVAADQGGVFHDRSNAGFFVRIKRRYVSYSHTDRVEFDQCVFGRDVILIFVVRRMEIGVADQDRSGKTVYIPPRPEMAILRDPAIRCRLDSSDLSGTVQDGSEVVHVPFFRGTVKLENIKDLLQVVPEEIAVYQGIFDFDRLRLKEIFDRVNAVIIKRAGTGCRRCPVKILVDRLTQNRTPRLDIHLLQ